MRMIENHAFADRRRRRWIDVPTAAIRQRCVALAAGLLVFLATPVSAQTASFLASGQSGSESAGSIVIPVELDQISASDEYVPYVLSGSAVSPADYTISPASPILIPAGQPSAALIVAPVNDGDAEGAEDIVIDLPGQSTWWDTAWRFRVPISIDSSTQVRTDHVVEVAIDFTALLAGLGESGALELDSLRVVEVDGDQVVLDAGVPFQFDPDAGFDPLSQASGTLLFQLVGVTPASTVRDYHVYFDTESGFTPAVVMPQVVFTDDVMDEGQLSYQIDTTAGTYLYHKLGGGFSSMVDTDGNDWIDYHETGEASGNYRGIPNLTHTAGYFHPGLSTSVTTLVASGPLRVSFESASADQTWRVRWDVFPEKARLRVLAAPSEYWFLYEGAPGGSLQTGSDFIVRSTGVFTFCSVSWAGDIPGEEWFFVSDPVVGRSIYFVNHTGDGDVDSYWPLGGVMTVLGFGRLGNGQPLAPQMTGAPRDFTMGFIDQTEYAVASGQIRGAYFDVVQGIGAAEDRDLGPITRFTLTLEDVPSVPGLGVLGGGVLAVCLLLAVRRRAR